MKQTEDGLNYEGVDLNLETRENQLSINYYNVWLRKKNNTYTTTRI